MLIFVCFVCSFVYLFICSFICLFIYSWHLQNSSSTAQCCGDTWKYPQQSLFVTDCDTPVGMEDGRIKDSQITASSHWNEHLAHNARLNNEAKKVHGRTSWGAWCSDKTDKQRDPQQYLQVRQTSVAKEQRDNMTSRQTDSQTDRQTNWQMQTNKQTAIVRHTELWIIKNRQRDTHTQIETERQAMRQVDTLLA